MILILFSIYLKTNKYKKNLNKLMGCKTLVKYYKT